MEYYADRDGNVYNINGLKLKQQPHKKGYLYFTEYYGQGKKRTRTVHKFIWEYFNGEVPYGLEINHINHIKTDNRLSNLELTTPKENNRHRPYCTLNMELAEEIRDRYLKEDITMRKLAKEYNCGSTTIFNVINDLTWV